MKKLSATLQHARSNIEFYEYLKDVDLKKMDYNDFMSIPLLTKDIIRNSGESLLNNNFQNRSEIIEATSGGSTGEPLSFYRTKSQNLFGMTNYYYACSLNGVNFYDKSLELWGAERDMHNLNQKFNLKRFLYNKTILNTFILSDEIIDHYIFEMNRLKPKFIKAYVHSIYDISKYINENNIEILFKPIIHCTTGPLYPEMRTEIMTAFNDAHIYSFYGSREVSAIATETVDLEKFQVLYDNVFVEILNEDDLPVKNGEEGEIVVTTLNNFYMPLIRYKIGDRGIKGDNLVFGTLKINTVVGRTLGVIHTLDGRKIDGQFFTSLFFNRLGIRKFQLVQKTISQLQLNIIKSHLFEDKELAEIVERIYKELPGVKIKINFCKNIDLTSTGKLLYVLSEI